MHGGARDAFAPWHECALSRAVRVDRVDRPFGKGVFEGGPVGWTRVDRVD